MAAPIKQEETEILSPEEYMERWHIKKSTLHFWKSQGWLVPGRDFVKVGTTVRYFWSADRLVEIHERCQAGLEARKQKDITAARKEPGERVNWGY